VSRRRVRLRRNERVKRLIFAPADALAAGSEATSVGQKYRANDDSISGENRVSIPDEARRDYRE
jgi:deoxycytidine triphosphate deaminase